MRLLELLSGLPGVRRVDTGGDPEVRALSFDSREAAAGGLFLAVKGARSDGAAFGPQALAAGAAAVLADRAPDTDPSGPWFVADDVRDLSGRLAARLFEDAFATVIPWAVTGTKGKTTTTRMLASILSAGGIPCGSVGTLGWRDQAGDGGPLANTTPDAARLGSLVAELAARGCRAVAVEASSQAAIQARLRHLPLGGMAFLNLSPEHAELHPTMDAYRAAKAQLFADAARVRPFFAAVVPAGSEDAAAMVEAAGPSARVLTFGDGPDSVARGRVLAGGLTHLELELDVAGTAGRVRLPLGGRFNLQNALAAAAMAHAAGLGFDAVRGGLEALPPVRGRFEVLERDGAFAMVDYAHSSDALEKLLASCREVAGAGRVLVVFGCGGKKDPGKRPRMGASAAAHADEVWVTNDNPRGEPPAEIAEQVLTGVPAGSRDRVRVELDRRGAIRAALAAARPGDLVVVAGKGHETTQDLGHEVIEFDDREEILRYWAEV